MDCVYRNQNTGWCGQTTGPQGSCYPSGMTGYGIYSVAAVENTLCSGKGSEPGNNF